MLRTAFRLMLICGLGLALGTTLALANEEPAPIRLSVDDGRLTLEAERAPLRDVLEAVGARAGFTVELRGEVVGEVSPSIRNRPLHRAIGDLLDAGDHSFFLRFAPREPGERGPKLAHLTVIGSKAAGAQALTAPADGVRVTGTESGTPGPSADPEEEAMDEALEILRDMLQEDDKLLREAAAEALADLDEIPAAD